VAVDGVSPCLLSAAAAERGEIRRGRTPLGLEQAAELFDGEKFVAYSGAVGLDPRVLPGRSGLDVAGTGATEAAPVPQGPFAVSSGPLSQRMNSGCPPRVATIVSRQVTVASASMEWARAARDSRVYSSTTCRNFRTRPAAVTSN
jgi:hypothetical protein